MTASSSGGATVDATTTGTLMSDTYLADPSTLTDEELSSWLRNFHDQPPTLDLMQEWSWARSISEEAIKRGVVLESQEKPELSEPGKPLAEHPRGVAEPLGDLER
jgi:hypothetical protein